MEEKNYESVGEFKDKIKQLEEIIGYTFKDKSLLLAAITHRSFVAEYHKKIQDYEVLEFLGRFSCWMSFMTISLKFLLNISLGISKLY